MKSTHFFKPYDKEGRYTLKQTGCGVYVIKKSGIVCYVGMSRKDVRSTMYRHFQQWTDNRNKWMRAFMPYERITYHGQDRNLFSVKIILCNTEREASILEQLLIKKLRPKDNTLKLELYSQADYKSVEKALSQIESWKPGNIGSDFSF